MGIDLILQILSGEEFFKGMMELVEPLSAEVIRNHLWVELEIAKETRRNLMNFLVGPMAY